MIEEQVIPNNSLKRKGRATLAVSYHEDHTTAPTLLFCPGYRSDMQGTKAMMLYEYAKTRELSCLRFDYSGHGLSTGNYEEGTISSWTQDALDVIDAYAKGPLVIVGSSMGGWIALNIALTRPEIIKALILIAPAPDFTRYFFHERLNAEQRGHLDTQGYVKIPNSYSDEPYHVRKAFIEDGARHCLLDRKIAVRCPIRILHGQQDESVPWQHSLTLTEKLESNDVRLTFVKTGDHSLSTPQDLALLSTTLEDVMMLSK